MDPVAMAEKIPEEGTCPSSSSSIEEVPLEAHRVITNSALRFVHTTLADEVVDEVVAETFGEEMTGETSIIGMEAVEVGGAGLRC